jgi:signal recognition particle GTPase
MLFSELKEIIVSQLLEVDIELEIIDQIMNKNTKMFRDYDKDEYEDQVILNHKIAAIIEIVFKDNQYKESKNLSESGHKKINNILKSKF